MQTSWELTLERDLSFLLAGVHLDRYTVVQYGSSLHDGCPPRDVDILVLSPDLKEVKCLSLTPGTGSIPWNVYYCPISVFRRDVLWLSFGGYYCHKVALVHRSLITVSTAFDAGALFWRREAVRFRNGHGRLASSDELTKWVHLRILSFRPSFARSLANFLRSPKAFARLTHAVESYSLPLSENPDIGWSSSRQGTESAFLRFWSEYEKHKGDGNVWSARTMRKMAMSLDAYDCDLLQDYFKGMKLDL